MIRLAVFASGRGSNFQTIYHKIRDGQISAEIVSLVTDNENAGALDFAQEHTIGHHIVKPKEFPSADALGAKLLEILHKMSVDWIVLAGYLRKIPQNVVAAYTNCMLNIHPALLPAFGGKGMYGMRVHEAVFNAGVHYSGVTVHLVNNEYDAGPIVLQRVVNIAGCQSPEDIARKVLIEEHIAYPDALKLLFDHNYEVKGQRVIIYGKKND